MWIAQECFNLLESQTADFYTSSIWLPVVQIIKPTANALFACLFKLTASGGVTTFPLTDISSIAFGTNASLVSLIQSYSPD